MLPIRICSVLFWILSSSFLFAKPVVEFNTIAQIIKDTGAWTFSGTIRNEASEQFGYFFEVQRQQHSIHVKTALIDGQNNQLLFSYEDDEPVVLDNPIDWNIGRAFIRHNAINDSWVFGVKVKDNKGFNFKVDMLSQSGHSAIQTLRPGIMLQAVQTSELNGHVQLGDKEQFITGNKTWFSQLSINNEKQATTQDIHATYCRLDNQDGFYSAKLSENNLPSTAVAGWLDAKGNRIKMSQFISIKSTPEHSLVQVGLPKLSLKILNTLKNESLGQSVAGFAKENKQAFCFVSRQSYTNESVIG